MRELSRSKVGLGVAFALALIAATRILYGISVLPPGLKDRPPDAGAASTHVLIDTPHSTMLDLSEDVYGIRSLAARAVILGNVMASPQVREYIARRAGVGTESIVATGPLTPEQPRPIAAPGTGPAVSDIVKPPDEYRLSVQANPTVPILDIYAQAPSAQAAEQLANGAVDGLRDYLDDVAAERRTTGQNRIELEQLGSAEGGLINSGAGVTIALLVFVLVFVVSSAAVLFINRIRRGWVTSGGFERPPARGVT